MDKHAFLLKVATKQRSVQTLRNFIGMVKNAIDVNIEGAPNVGTGPAVDPNDWNAFYANWAAADRAKQEAELRKQVKEEEAYKRGLEADNRRARRAITIGGTATGGAIGGVGGFFGGRAAGRSLGGMISGWNWGRQGNGFGGTNRLDYQNLQRALATGADWMPNPGNPNEMAPVSAAAAARHGWGMNVGDDVAARHDAAVTRGRSLGGTIGGIGGAILGTGAGMATGYGISKAINNHAFKTTGRAI